MGIGYIYDRYVKSYVLYKERNGYIIGMLVGYKSDGYPNINELPILKKGIVTNNKIVDIVHESEYQFLIISESGTVDIIEKEYVDDVYLDENLDYIENL